MKDAFYIQRIKRDFAQKQKMNPSYSLRAYAKNLGIPASTLNQVLLGKRTLPKTHSQNVIKKLHLTAQERTLFLKSLRPKFLLDEISVSDEHEKYLINEKHFQVISEWEHYAVVMLFDCDGFEPTYDYICKRLDLSRIRAEVIIQNLQDCGLIKTVQSKWVRTQSRLATTEDTFSDALRAAHRNSLSLAAKKIDDVSLDLRDFSSLTLPINTKKLDDAKTIIREFRKKMMALMDTENKNEVYELAIQFYPLTKSEKL